MGSTARIRANRTNALSSTGPRTATGKIKVATNAIKAGLFARTLVVPALGENANEFEQFRLAVVTDLEPNGSVEWELADRVAGLLWRMRRVVRYESAAMSCPTARLPRHPDEVDRREADDTVPLPSNAPADRRLALVRLRLHHTRYLLEALRRAIAVARDLAELPAAGGVDWRVIELILDAAGELLGWLPVCGEPDRWAAMAAELGFGDPRIGRADWASGQLRDLVCAAAKSSGHEPGPCLRAVAERVEAGLAETEESVSRLEAEERDLVGRMLREREVAIAGPAFAERGVVEQVARAETHLSRELDRTLSQLERLRDWREQPRGAAWAASVIVGLPRGVEADDASDNGFVSQNRPSLAVGGPSDSMSVDDAAVEAVPVAPVREDR